MYKGMEIRKGEQSFKREGEPEKDGHPVDNSKMTGEREGMYCRGNKAGEGKERRMKGQVREKREREKGILYTQPLFFFNPG